MKTTSQAGIDLIKQFEGERLTSYYCPAGVLTIGTGHTGSDVKPNQTITGAESLRLLQGDLRRFEKAVNSYVKVPLTQNQFDALVCFAFNVGTGALASSTLLKLLNAGKYKGAQAQFGRWNKAGGKALAGLTRRRAAEAALFGRA